MTSFNIGGFSTAQRTLLGGETGSIGRNGILETSGTSVTLASGTMVTNLGSVTSLASSALSISGAAQVVNDGLISSFAAVLFAGGTGASTVTVFNTGDILGLGVAADGIRKDSGGLVLQNSGTIQTVGDPCVNLFASNATRANSIINSGLLANTNPDGHAILSDRDVETVTNTGTIIGQIALGTGNDVLRGAGVYTGDVSMDGGDDIADLRGGQLNGRLSGGAGNDTLTAAAGDDLVEGGDNNDFLRGAWGDDTLAGGRGTDNLQGQAGGDQLFGGEDNDLLSGGDGADILVGGVGRDTLTGGAGADMFDFNVASETQIGLGDLIGDLRRGEDRIDVSGIDARANVAGQQEFAFIGGAAFSQTGQLRVVDLGQDVRIEMNTDGSAAADAAILVKGVGSLGAGDFLL